MIQNPQSADSQNCLMQILQISLIITAAAAPLFADPEMELSAQIQPRIQCIQNHSWQESGDLQFDVNRAKIGVELKREIGKSKISGTIEIDPVNQEDSSILREASAEIEIQNHFEIRSGFMRQAASADLDRPSRKLPFIERNEIAEYLKDAGIGSVKPGFSACGKFLDDKVRAELSIFQPLANSERGMRIKDLMDNPMIIVTGTPIEQLHLRGTVAVPQLGYSLADGQAVLNRMVFASLAGEFTFPRIASISCELLKAPDSADAQTMTNTIKGFHKTITKGISLESSFLIDLPQKWELTLSQGADLYRGYQEDENHKLISRPDASKLYASARIAYGKHLFTDLVFRTALSESKLPLDQRSIQLQLTWYESIRLKEISREKD